MIIDYIVVFLIVSLLTLAAQLGLRLYTDRQAVSFQRAWQEADKLHPLQAGLIGIAILSLVEQGWDSPAFAISGIVALVAIAFGIRVKRLEETVQQLRGEKTTEDALSVSVLEQIYSFVRTWAGAVWLGATFGLLVTFTRWNSLNIVTDIPDKGESRAYVYVFVAIIATSIILLSRLNTSHMRKLPTASRLRRIISNGWLVPALVGLVFAALQNATLNESFTNRYFIFIVFYWMFTVELWAIANVLPGSIQRLSEERAHFESEQKRIRRKKRRKSRR